MAFWGVEVKPGKPYTHRYEASHGRLRICQATLGNCDATARTVLQCNVGNKVPIKLCSLNPKLAEMCHLEVEFEEVDDVVFSVIGQSSIHLSGHYVGASSKGGAAADESESYGEDVGQSDTDEELASGEDSYESDFIDDRDVVPEESHGSDSIEDSEKPTRKVGRRHRLKKCQVDSVDDKDDDSPYKPPAKRRARSIFDSCSDDDDDDNMPISVALGKKDSSKVAEEIKSSNVQAKDDTRKKNTDAQKRKSCSNSEDPASPMDITDANAPSPSKQDAGSKKKSKKKMRHQVDADLEKRSNARTLDDGLIVEDLSTGNKDAKIASTGSKVYIKYVGMLKDGKVVESNVNEKPYKFKLGAGKVIRGWDVGISGMRVGDKRRLTVPPSMCYGDKSVGDVPKNSSVVYEVELVKVK
ncbi:hypothetical protein EJB05_44759 [Eragrostis curvula]|uniref:peptidylprolyl isomerase n=1 Tax=Eragrostis curvula TaxID=38414 RepID=A0A5J9TIL9_9POAL|nr:hypothetical protein EJB05_44759 [Eragrostis curvula]